jgi:hypothetical protein
MKCKKSKEKIILYLYGELSETEKAELDDHLKECSECSHDLEYTKKVFKLVDSSKEEALPEANWERSWEAISSGVEPKPERRKRLFLFPAWAYASAALVLVFALGIIIGGLWIPSLQKAPLSAEGSPVSMDQPLKEHFEALKPVLTEYANYSPLEQNGPTVTIDKEILENLLLQNYLLRRAIAKSNNPSLEQFLEDIDLILREVTNLRNGDQPTLSLIKDTILQREILFKMEVFQNI